MESEDTFLPQTSALERLPSYLESDDDDKVAAIQKAKESENKGLSSTSKDEVSEQHDNNTESDRQSTEKSASQLLEEIENADLISADAKRLEEERQEELRNRLANFEREKMEYSKRKKVLQKRRDVLLSKCENLDMLRRAQGHYYRAKLYTDHEKLAALQRQQEEGGHNLTTAGTATNHGNKR